MTLTTRRGLAALTTVASAALERVHLCLACYRDQLLPSNLDTWQRFLPTILDYYDPVMGDSPSNSFGRAAETDTSAIDDFERLWALIPEDASWALNAELRRRLGWEKDRYWAARDELLQDGRVEVGRGRGGRIRRPVEPVVEQVMPSIVEEELGEATLEREAAAEARAERRLYEPMQRVIEGDWAKDRAMNLLAVETTAYAGGRQTGGKWSRPDITAVAVEQYQHVPGKFLELISFEVKPEGSVDVAAVYEALSHRRSATLSYVIFHVPDARLGDHLTTISQVARSHGIGIIIAGQPDDYDTWDEKVPAERNQADPASLGEFISKQLSPTAAETIRLAVR